MNQTRALTVRQPWAACIAHYGKTIENRTWSTRWRGTLLIHAAKTADPDTFRVIHGEVRGAIVAIATLTDCHPDDGACTRWSEPGAFHWVLADIRPLAQPVACPGALGLWTPSPDILAAVQAVAGQQAPIAP